MTTPFLRKAILSAWNTNESAYSLVSTEVPAIQFVSDGTLSGFGMRFTVHRSKVSAANYAQIILHNLKPATQAQLRGRGLKVALDVGWSNQEVHRIFVGSLMRAVTQRYGPNLLTTLHCMTGADAMSRGIFSGSFGSGTPLRDGVRSAALTLKPFGVNIDTPGGVPRISVDPDPEHPQRFGSGGRSYAGRTQDFLDSLAGEWGFSWSIQNSTFQAIHDSLSFPRTWSLSAQNGTLISAVPVLFSVNQVVVGVEAKAILIPDILPCDRIQITSGLLGAEINGTYIASEVEYIGSPVEQEWTMLVKCLSLDKAGAL